MKLNGQPLRMVLRRTFELPRAHGEPVLLTLSPLSLGFHQGLHTCGIRPPVPPVKIARDSTGKPLRDSAGQAVTLADTQHPDYLAELELYHQRVAVLAIAESLQEDPQLRFETTRPIEQSATSWTNYADAIFRELEESGFTAGDVVLLCREICRLSNLFDVQLTEAQANFSQQTRSGSS